MYRGKRNNCQLNSKRAIKAWMTWEKSLRNPQITMTKNYRKKYHAPLYSQCSLFTKVIWFFFLALDEGGCSSNIVFMQFNSRH